eukprot:2815487-Prymnesium_polylepis.1
MQLFQFLTDTLGAAREGAAKKAQAQHAASSLVAGGVAFSRHMTPLGVVAAGGGFVPANESRGASRLNQFSTAFARGYLAYGRWWYGPVSDHAKLLGGRRSWTRPSTVSSSRSLAAT